MAGRTFLVAVATAVVAVGLWAGPAVAAATRPFHASYSGTRTADPSNPAVFHLTGNVTGSLGAGTFSGWGVESLLTAEPTFTLTTTSVYPHGTLTQTEQLVEPPGGPATATASITGGTGRFAGATGSLTIVPASVPGADSSSGEFSYTATGTIVVGGVPPGRFTWGGPVLIDPPTLGSNFSPLGGISCSTPDLCAVAGGGGDTAVSTNPIDGAWTPTGPLDEDGFFSVACRGRSLCVLGDDEGAVVTSRTPVSGPWSARLEIDPPSNPPLYNRGLTSVSCPSVRLCVIADQLGAVLTSTNPAGGTSAWSPAVQVDGFNDIYTVSCPTTNLCVAGDIAGNVITSTAPTAGASAWAVRAVDPGHWIDSISCPSRRLCVAVDNDGRTLVSTDPTGGASAWRANAIAPPGRYLMSVSCAHRARGRGGVLCAAVDSIGDAYVTENVLADPATWTANVLVQVALTGVSCASTDLCVAVDNVGAAVVGAPAS